MPRPPIPPHERRFGPRWEEPTHAELMDAIAEINTRLDRIEESLGRR